MPPLIENAARSGLIVAAFVLGFLVLSNIGGFAGIPALISGVAGAVYLMRQQRHRDRESIEATGRGVPAAALASYGIAIAFFAALPVALLVYVALRFVWPDLIVTQLETSVDILSRLPEYATLTAQLQTILEKGPIPTATDMMASVLMLMMLSGLFLGITGAIIAKILNR